MKPKDKAIELVSTMYNCQSGSPCSWHEAKGCALIAVQLSMEFITGDLSESFDKTLYLLEVKEEIEKL